MLAKTTTKSAEAKRFAKINGLVISPGTKTGILIRNPQNRWLDCFDTWADLHAFFIEAEAQQRNGVPYPWRKAA